MVTLIVAVSDNNVIGRENKLPWQVSTDMLRFKDLTSGNVVIMGRKTYESIGRPLPNRVNIVVTSKGNHEFPGVYTTAISLKQALYHARTDEPRKEVFIIGGSMLYEHALSNKLVDRILLTKIHAIIPDGDAHFPEIDTTYWSIVSSKDFAADWKDEYASTFIEYRPTH